MVEALSSYLIGRQQNNLILLHFFTLAEFFAFSSFIYFHLKSRHILTLMYIVIWIGFTLTAIFEMAINGIYVYNSFTRGLESILIVLLLIYFVSNRKSHTWRGAYIPLYCMFVGLFIYFGPQMFNFIWMENVIQTKFNLALLLKNYHAWINIFSNILYTMSFIFLYSKKHATIQ